MKLALIGPVYPYRGGVAHYTTMLCQAMLERGYQLLVVSFRRQYPSWLFPGQSDRDPSEEPLHVADVRYWIDSMNPITWFTTFVYLCHYRPAVLVLQWWTSFWAPVWLTFSVLNRLFLRVPLVFVCHNILPHEERWGDIWLTRLVLRWGTKHIVQSERERERLHRLLPRARVEVIPHPVYDMFADQRIPKDAARKRLNLPGDVSILLSFGFVREYKGLPDLLRTMPRIRQILGEVILLIAGEFWGNKQDYIDMIEELEIDDCVMILDRYIRNEEVPVFFSAADLLVAPYRRATGSGVVQLALGLGLPVVTTDVCWDGMCEAGGGVVGVVPVGDLDRLTEEILGFFRQRGYRVSSEFVGKCQERSSWNRLADSIAFSRQESSR